MKLAPVQQKVASQVSAGLAGPSAKGFNFPRTGASLGIKTPVYAPSVK